jgi:ribose 1,5-bisphosphokinase
VLLARWGYPYVLDEFRFHFTLTGPTGEAPGLAYEARQALAKLADTPLWFDAVSLVTEPSPGAAFREVHRSRLRRPGRLIYVVGPSGAGKDSVIAWVRERLPADSSLAFARRAITRAAQADGEQHEPVTDAEFAERLARGDFALHWEANGCRYGIGREIVGQLQAGMTVVVCGSRAHLSQARLAFPDLEAVHVTAPPDVRLRRLMKRGREAPGAVSARLARAMHVGTPALELVNDRAIEDSGTRLLRYLLG